MQKVRHLFTLFAIAAISIAILLTGSLANAEEKDVNLVAPYFEGSITVDGVLDETYWSRADWGLEALGPSNQFGGHIQSAKVKVIHNGSWIFFASQWKDSSEDRFEMPRIRLSAEEFFHNATYHYSDQFILGWWFMDETPTENPWANTQYAGTTKGNVPWKTGRGSLWVWRGYQSDQDSPFWPVPYYDPRAYRWGPRVGEPLIYPHPHAYETLLNATANYLIGSYITHVRACAYPDKETYPFDVWARAKWDNGNWTLEIGRPFIPNEMNQGLTMQFAENGHYYLFLAAYDGLYGEIESTSSISPWLTLYLEPKPQSQDVVSPLLLVSMVSLVVAAALITSYVVFRRSKRPA